MFAKGSVTEFGGEILDDQSRHVVVVSCVQRCVWWEGVVVMSRETKTGQSIILKGVKVGSEDFDQDSWIVDSNSSPLNHSTTPTPPAPQPDATACVRMLGCTVVFHKQLRHGGDCGLRRDTS